MWSRFEPSVIEDETINNAFSTNGLFKIGFEGDEEVSKSVPHLQSVVQNEKMVIAVEQSLFLLQNENATNANFVELPASFDCFCVSNSGNIVVSCLSDGSIIGCHIDGKVLFNLVILEEDIQQGHEKSFTGITSLGNDFYALTTYGKLYRLSNIDEKLMLDLCEESENSTVNETLSNNVILERLFNFKQEFAIQNFVIFDHFGKVMCIFSIRQEMYFYHENAIQKIKMPKWIPDVKSIYNFDHYIIGLTTEGKLFEICPFTKMMSKIEGYDFLLEELILMESNSEEIELLCLTKPDESSRCIKIITFPLMNCKNELTMELDTWLVGQSKSSVNMYYVNGVRNAAGNVCKIEMKIISETEPELRLKKLIQREHFDEAKEFALQFELSLQPIFEAKARKLCNQIAFQQRLDIEVAFNELHSILKEIESPIFFNSVAQYEFPNRNIMKTYLEFISSRLNSNEFANSVKAITEKLLRLETLKLIDPNELYLEWRQFVHHTNLLNFCKEMFKSNFAAAQLIWSRHTASLLPYTTINGLVSFLNAVPATVEPFDIVQWLKHFTPSVLQIYPNFMSHIVEWSIAKTKSLQYSPYWPEIGLEFANNINGILKDVKFLYANIQRKYESCIEAIDEIIIALEDLSILKKSYNLNITMDDYIKDSMEDTAYNLLQRVQLSNFNALVNDFLYPIFKEKCLSPENSIKKYIHYLALHNHYTDWAERSVTAIEMLHNENDKFSSALTILKAAPVPWSPILNELMKYGEGGHPLAQEIYVEYKNQAIKVMKKKYGWPLDLPAMDLMLLVKRIIFMNLPEMVNDVKMVLENASDITVQANIYLVLMLVKSNKVETAFEFLKDVKTEYRKEVYTRLISTVIQMIDNRDVENNENYLDLIKTIDSLLNGECSQRVHDIIKVLKLRNEFGLSVNIINLHETDELLRQGIVRIIEIISKLTEKSLFHQIMSKLKRLSIALDVPLTQAILEFCMHAGNKSVTMNFVAFILSSSMRIEKKFIPHIIELIVVVLKQELLMVSYDDESPDLLVYALTHKLLERIQIDDTLYVAEINELFQWTIIGTQFYRNHEISDALKDFQKDHQITKDMLKKSVTSNDSPHDKNVERKRVSLSVFEQISSPIERHEKNLRANDEINVANRALSIALKTVILFANSEELAMMKLKNYLQAEMQSESNEEDLTNELTSLLEKLIKNKQHMRAFLIMQRLRQYKSEAGCSLYSESHRKSLQRKVLKAIITQKNVNFNEGLNVLLSDNFTEDQFAALKEAVKVSEAFTINYFTLLEKYFQIKGDRNQVIAAKRARIEFCYHQELCRIDETLKYKKSLDFSSIQDLVKDLKGRALPTDLLQKMSQDFGWNYDEILVLQIINLLSTQKLEFETTTDVFGKEEIQVKTTVDELMNVCQPYVNEIHDRVLLAREIKQHLKQFNFYFYELYLCSIKILEYIDQLPVDMELWKNVLTFLIQSSTTRKNRAGQIESDWWFKTSPDGAVLPQIAKYRVPFFPLIAEPLKNILDNEISVDNCEKWLPLIQLVSLIKNEDPQDEIECFCMTAVKNSFTERKTIIEDTGVWLLTETNDRFLQGVLRLVDHMRSKSRIAFMLYFTMNYSPEGIDQVNAAHHCYNFIITHEEELIKHPKAKDIVMKIKQKYPILKIQHLLHQYGLVEDRLMILAQNPYELISTLYTHESILKDQKFNINRLNEEIAKLHGLDLYRIQMKLVEKWLGLDSQVRRSCEGGETTLLEETAVHGGEDDFGSVSDENIVRAYYILKSWDTEKAMSFLQFFILEPHTSNSTGKELQLVECYTKLSNKDNADTFEELISPEYYNILKCVHHMSQLGYKINKDKFKVVEKLTLLKEIWQKHADDTRGLELIVYICLGFEIYEPLVWNGVLKQMIAKDMIQHLQSLVVILSTRTELLHVSALTSAWMAVIKAPFIRGKSSDSDQTLTKSLILLQSCPLSAYLDYVELTELCLRLGRVHIAALFIAYASEKQTEKLINMIQPYITNRLKSEIQELKEFGIIPSIIQSAIATLRL